MADTRTAVHSDVSGKHADMPPAVLAWLQDLLRERFHDDLMLEQTQSDFVDIFVAGHDKRVRVRSDFSMFQRKAADIPCRRWEPSDVTWLPEGCDELHAPGMAQPPPELVHLDEQGAIIHYDMLGLAYWMLSRYEEVGSKNIDEHQRFRAEASHAFRHGYLERPIVDEWFEVLRRVITDVWPRLPLRQHRYGIRLSHDVDTPARYALISPLRLMGTMLVDLVRDRHRDRRALMQAPSIWANSRKRIDPRDPFNTFEWIMDRSEEAGLRNAFYFICGHTDPGRDGYYTPEQPAIVDLMRQIHARGHKIGLHPSYNTYLNPAALRAEAERLRRASKRAGVRQEDIGARMHYLRWETPTTLHGLEAAGLVYDTTLGYARHPGFRCGTCHEYQAFDPVQGKALKLRVRPLIVMESTIIEDLAPSGVSSAEARMQRLMDACRRVRGTFTLLWHNTMLEHAHQRLLYERVLHHHKEATK